MPLPPNLRTAYGRTRYLVRHNGMMPALRVDYCEELPSSAWLASRYAALITADNPASVQRDSKLNRLARQSLVKTLQDTGRRYLPTEAHSADGQWPVEQGCLIFAIHRSQAIALATRFGQLALLWVPRGEPVELVETELTNHAGDENG